MEAKITKDMLIGDVVSGYPSVVDVLLKQGIHCVGCGASYMETIEEGLMGHGKTEEEVTAIVKELNESIPSEEGSSDGIIVTENAATKLKELLDEQKKKALRIQVMAGGCSGFKYGMELVDDVAEGEERVEVAGIAIALDKESFTMLKGAKVDYLDSLQGAGFKITNPNAVNTCGCGQSFH